VKAAARGRTTRLLALNASATAAFNALAVLPIIAATPPPATLKKPFVQLIFRINGCAEAVRPKANRRSAINERAHMTND
jgi:hypothetical protein